MILVLAVLGYGAWASDFITLQGERTVYTVGCQGGEWQGEVCSGKLVAGDRYRYRALKPHHEVIFWKVGARDRSGKFDRCDIHDGRNWVCAPSDDASRSITLAMDGGVPVPGPPTVTRPFRAVSKWRWILLRRGLSRKKVVPLIAAAPSPAH
ncbi:MAG TPA: hypothetical protein VFF72_06515 [Caldimonas sp.]|nr:hypothetical protein [Caldimonas sp.]